jgi:hypothetical protein
MDESLSSLHVDIVRSDWSDGVERVIARAQLSSTGITVDVMERYPSVEMLLAHPLFDPGEREYVYSSKEPDRFFALLPTVFVGSYLHASSAHSVRDCPFGHSETRAMASVDVRSPALSSHKGWRWHS